MLVYKLRNNRYVKGEDLEKSMVQNYDYVGWELNKQFYHTGAILEFDKSDVVEKFEVRQVRKSPLDPDFDNVKYERL